MKKLLMTLLCIGIYAMLHPQSSDVIQLQVNASKKIATVSRLFNGTNIEDLNNQTNGGIFSQLLHGEAFEENIDIDFLNLPVGEYVKVYVVLDEMKRPHFLTQANIYNRIIWNNLTEKYDFNSKDIYAAGPFKEPFLIGPLVFNTRFVVYDSIPEDIRDELVSRINGDEQISRYWNKIVSGDVLYRFELRRGNAYMGRQNQILNFIDGNGECGIYNSGLNKQGINLIAGKPYDGILRIRSDKALTVFLSLRDENGKLLAEKSYKLNGDGTYEKVNFELISSGSTPKGSFGISLKDKGEIELGFAFMQPGSWGRINDYPIRKEFAEALIRQGIKSIRYNGSMVDVGADTYLYRWKKMLGPVDERKVCYRSGFNPYATHSFGVIELAQVAEVIGAEAMIGLSMDETYEDIRDFVEYMNGPVNSRWGKLRAYHGHPKPYNLKYIQVDNERWISRGYVECMKKFALAAWESDPEMHIVASLNFGRDPSRYSRGTVEYDLSSELFGWFIQQGKACKMVWDPHYWADVSKSNNFFHAMGIQMQSDLEKDYPGYKLTLCPMEENGTRCDWHRGLDHAHNWNKIQRHGNHFTMVGTANTFQPHGQHYMWDQGRIHYTSDQIWFQPSAYIDQKMTEDWLPVVVETSSSNDRVLDITAKTNGDKDTLSVYVANLSDIPQEAIINISDFKFRGKAQTWVIGDCDLTELNTVDNQKNVVPVTGSISFSKKNAKYTFPRNSYTVLTLIR